MKSIATALALMLLLFAVALQAQTPASKPGPEHKKMETYFAGDWTYEGETKLTPIGPAGKFSGKQTAKMILGGFFVEFRGEEKGSTITPQWTEIDGYDPTIKKYTWNSYDNSGGFQRITYTLEGNKMDFSGTLFTGGKQYMMRGETTFASDLGSAVGKFEISVDGKTWMPFQESKSTRIKSKP
jgi:hypothetical protein